MGYYCDWYGIGVGKSPSIVPIINIPFIENLMPSIYFLKKKKKKKNPTQPQKGLLFITFNFCYITLLTNNLGKKTKNLNNLKYYYYYF